MLKKVMSFALAITLLFTASTVAYASDKTKTVPVSVKQEQKITPNSYLISYKYVESTHYVCMGDTVTVSPTIQGPGTISYGTSHTFTESFSASISLSYDEKSAIRAGAGFSWNSSASNSSTFGVTYSVPAGKYGYVTFTPDLYCTCGTLYEQHYSGGVLVGSVNLGEVYAYSPVVLSNGICDGIYRLVTY